MSRNGHATPTRKRFRMGPSVSFSINSRSIDVGRLDPSPNVRTLVFVPFDPEFTSNYPSVRSGESSGRVPDRTPFDAGGKDAPLDMADESIRNRVLWCRNARVLWSVSEPTRFHATVKAPPRVLRRERSCVREHTPSARGRQRRWRSLRPWDKLRPWLPRYVRTSDRHGNDARRAVQQRCA